MIQNLNKDIFNVQTNLFPFRFLYSKSKYIYESNLSKIYE